MYTLYQNVELLLW